MKFPWKHFNDLTIEEERKRWKIVKIIYFLWGILLGTFFSAFSVLAQEEEFLPIEPPESMTFYYCIADDACYVDVGVVEENIVFNQYIAYDLQAGGPGLCVQEGDVTLYYWTGVWTKVSAFTPIQMVGGRNPRSSTGQGVPVCNANNTPRTTWALKAQLGQCGETFDMRATVDLDGSFTATFFDIVVEDCVTEDEYSLIDEDQNNLIYSSWDLPAESHLHTDYALLFYFLGSKIVLTAILIFL